MSLWVMSDWAGQAAGQPFLNYDVRSTPDSDQTADIEQGRGTPVSRARADANRLRDDLQSKIDYLRTQIREIAAA
jgi:hypothetical protein